MSVDIRTKEVHTELDTLCGLTYTHTSVAEHVLKSVEGMSTVKAKRDNTVPIIPFKQFV